MSEKTSSPSNSKKDIGQSNSPENAVGNESTPSRISYQERLALFEDAIKGVMDFDKVRSLAFSGIPEEPGLRSIYWKLLLSYLPNDRKLWKEVLEQKRKLYQEFIKELVIDPRKQEQAADHPLSTENNSVWNAFFKDKELIEEIDKDVKRTLPHLHFFNHDKSMGSTQHYEALKQILFIYGKLNPGVRYVQGMNEILGPIYYIFATDPDRDFKDNAEADTFFCFTNLMAEIRDNFIKSLDRSVVGITGLMARFSKVLQFKDPEIYEDFENKQINPQFYSFRWLTLLLSQEFDLPEVLRLWDSLFADPYRFEFLLFVCCAMLVNVRDQLLDGNFADNLKLVQHYPSTDIRIILAKAEELQKETYCPPSARPKPQSNQESVNHVKSPPAAIRKSSASKPKSGFKFFSGSPSTTQPPPKILEDKSVPRDNDSVEPSDFLMPPKAFEDEDENPSKVPSKTKAQFSIDDEEEAEDIKSTEQFKSHPLE